VGHPASYQEFIVKPQIRRCFLQSHGIILSHAQQHVAPGVKQATYLQGHVVVIDHPAISKQFFTYCATSLLRFELALKIGWGNSPLVKSDFE